MAKSEGEGNDLARSAAETTLALNPIVGLRGEDLAAAGFNLMRSMAGRPDLLAKQWMGFASAFADIVLQRSELAPDPKDRRFADPGWGENIAAKGAMQAWHAWAKAVNETVEQLDLPDRDAARARLVSSIFVDAMAPSNNPMLNPAALRKLYETKGASALSGLQNLVEDVVKNGGLPASVDRSKFAVGGNLATTPGAVVFRNEVIELIHYTATTPEVRRTPLVIVPPQINKYYAVDLAPSKSMVRFLLSQGFQPFCISWRNPTAKQRDWTLQTYVEALDEAVEASREITGADAVNMMGSCSGGITLSSYAGWLAAKGEGEKIGALILAVCVLDTEAQTESDMAALVTPETVIAAKRMSEMRGVLDGQELAKMFAWMRPNDLIWNYWVNNYLLGEAPPAFDVLFWNADTTRLPAGLHHDFLDLIFTNPFVNPGAMSIGGHAIDMTKVRRETYVIAGTTDHITPWKAVYGTARLFGPETTFILSNSGHLQSLLNPPGNPKAWYVKGKAGAADPEAWLETGEKKAGSWWEDWAAFLGERSGETIPAPKAQGSKAHPVIGPAPGTYVFEP